jgi:hypothetical protein
MKSIFQMIWWKVMNGRTIKIYAVNWNNLSEYFDFLTEHVGMEGLSWDWVYISYLPYYVDATLIIRFRKGKEKYATLCQLKWC